MGTFNPNAIKSFFLALQLSQGLSKLSQASARVKFKIFALNVTEFEKRGLIHASDFSTLRMCNSASVGPTALKFGGRTVPSLY